MKIKFNHIRLLLILAMLCCIGSNICRHSTIPHQTAILTTQNIQGCSLLADINAFDDDQIFQPVVNSYTSEPGSILPAPPDDNRLDTFPVSFWQPPKNS